MCFKLLLLLFSIIPSPLYGTIRDKMKLEDLNIVIVGAGASGLSAASRLFENGAKNVTILEASDRMGGRIDSVNFNGNEIDMGAQWIHGQEGNVAFEMAESIGIIDDPDAPTLEDLGETFYNEQGDFIKDEVMEELWYLSESAEDSQEDYEHGPLESMASYFNQFFKKHQESLDSKENQTLNQYKDFLHRYYQNLDACDNWNNLSFYGSVHIYKECEGNDMVTFKTDHKYSDLLQHIVGNFPSQNVIQFNSKVSKISKKSVLDEEANKTEALFDIETSDGRKLVADYVIFTASLGVLKDVKDDLFDPPLPSKKALAIEKMSFGVINKVFLEFEESWWPKDSEGFGFFYDQTIDYSEEDAEKDWTRFNLGIYRVLHRDNILCLWIGSNGAKFMESLSDEQIQADIMKLMRKFLAKDYPDLPDPKAIKVSRWSSNPYTRGCYSYNSVETIKAGISAGDLAEPVGRLLFAGEATHPNFFSTVHGAIETGHREADRIINNHKQ